MAWYGPPYETILLIILLLRGVQARSMCFSRGESSPSFSGYWEPVSSPSLTKAMNAMSYDSCSGPFRSQRSCTAKHMLRFAKPVFWRVSNCSLPDFRVERFINALANRTIWLIGDSVTQQHKSRLACLVKSSNPLRADAVRGFRVSHGRHLTSLLARGRLGRVGKSDIVLFNAGLHFNTAKSYNDFLEQFETACLQKKCVKGKLVWVETAAQHFPGPDSAGGTFTAIRGKCVGGCAQHSYHVKAKADFRNKMATPLMLKYGVPVFRTWDVTASASNMHSNDVHGKSHTCDCTHYCNSPWGVFRVYNRILQAFLEQRHADADP